MFTAAWFIIVKKWKQHQCPSLTNDSTRCGIFIQWIITQLQERQKYWNMLQHGSTLKTLSKWSQKQKAIYYMISFKWNVQNRQIHRDINQTSDCRRMRKGTANGHELSFCSDGNALELDSRGASGAQLCERATRLWATHCKWWKRWILGYVNFTQ